MVFLEFRSHACPTTNCATTNCVTDNHFTLHLLGRFERLPGAVNRIWRVCINFSIFLPPIAGNPRWLSRMTPPLCARSCTLLTYTADFQTVARKSYLPLLFILIRDPLESTTRCPARPSPVFTFNHAPCSHLSPLLEQFTEFYYKTFDEDRKNLAALYVGNLRTGWGLGLRLTCSCAAR